MDEATTIEQQQWMELEEERRQEENEKAKEMQMAEEEGLSEEDLEYIKVKMPAKGNFVIFLFVLMLAILKDIVDLSLLGADLGIIGAIFGIFVGGIAAIWMFGKGMFIIKRLMKKIGFRILACFVASLIPGINVILPEMTILVLMTHFQHNKIVHGFTEALKKIAAQ